jgi:hypothetical protein
MRIGEHPTATDRDEAGVSDLREDHRCHLVSPASAHSLGGVSRHPSPARPHEHEQAPHGRTPASVRRGRLRLACLRSGRATSVSAGRFPAVGLRQYGHSRGAKPRLPHSHECKSAPSVWPPVTRAGWPSDRSATPLPKLDATPELPCSRVCLQAALGDPQPFPAATGGEPAPARGRRPGSLPATIVDPRRPGLPQGQVARVTAGGASGGGPSPRSPCGAQTAARSSACRRCSPGRRP